ncbi:MAG: hypothetical protein J0I07_30235 [Myxococcales bacterium]|nr:hypothetical protein [Myxococcales bacterium]
MNNVSGAKAIAFAVIDHACPASASGPRSPGPSRAEFDATLASEWEDAESVENEEERETSDFVPFPMLDPPPPMAPVNLMLSITGAIPIEPSPAEAAGSAAITSAMDLFDPPAPAPATSTMDASGSIAPAIDNAQDGTQTATTLEAEVVASRVDTPRDDHTSSAQSAPQRALETTSLGREVVQSSGPAEAAANEPAVAGGARPVEPSTPSTPRAALQPVDGAETSPLRASAALAGARTTEAETPSPKGKRLPRSAEALDAFSPEVTSPVIEPRAVTPPAGVEAPAETVKTMADVTVPAPVEASTRSGDGRAELGIRAAEAAGHRRALTGEAHGQIVVPELGRVEVRAVAGADRIDVHVQADEGHAKQVIHAHSPELSAHVHREIPEARVFVDAPADLRSDARTSGDPARSQGEAGHERREDNEGTRARSPGESAGKPTLRRHPARVRIVL